MSDDLFNELPFNLIQDEQDDPERLIREAEERKEAQAEQEKQQTRMFDET